LGLTLTDSEDLNPPPVSNSAKGRNSFDISVGNDLVHFFNRNVTPYATEAGGHRFDLVPVEKQKDIMLNVARLHAQQEYDRIMQLVSVLQAQAASIQRRLTITDAVHGAQYSFQIAHGNTYWLVYDTRKNITRLVMNGPKDWSAGPPEDYNYLAQVRWLGDHTWIEVDNLGNPVP
jgi:hypothetical protein